MHGEARMVELLTELQKMVKLLVKENIRATILEQTSGPSSPVSCH